MNKKSGLLCGYNADTDNNNINKLISVAKLTISKYK